jgi:hypothetical protein
MSTVPEAGIGLNLHARPRASIALNGQQEHGAGDPGGRRDRPEQEGEGCPAGHATTSRRKGSTPRSASRSWFAGPGKQGRLACSGTYRHEYRIAEIADNPCRSVEMSPQGAGSYSPCKSDTSFTDDTSRAAGSHLGGRRFESG